jgi:cysteinyl-tRNA synthetase, unknown class
VSIEDGLLIAILLAAVGVAVMLAIQQARARRPAAPSGKAQREQRDTSKPDILETATPSPGRKAPPISRNAVGTGAFDGVRTWGYQLQKVEMKSVAASPFDLMVVDYSRDGSDEQAFTPGDIARMKTNPGGGRRHVLAYMSIGEAESYRYYWKRDWATEKPVWMLGENPDWKQNYTVCFWDAGWQDTFCGHPQAYLDKIIAAGFDGVYLDKCDVFEDLQQSHKKIAKTRPDLEGDMVAFISRLSHYAKTKNPAFTLIMQNAEVLLEHETLRNVIDGVAKENLLYGLSGPEKPNPRDEIAFSTRALDLARRSGLTVFAVEYLNDAAKIRDVTERLDALGYISTISPKNADLAKLNTDPTTI